LTGEYLLEEQDRTFNQGIAVRFLEVIKLTKVLRAVLVDALQVVESLIKKRLLTRVISSSTLQSYREAVLKLNIATREAKLWQSKVEVDKSLSRLPDALTMVYPSAGNNINMNGMSVNF
jgi:phosphoribosyl-dephospho-CoA transferase